MKIVVAALMWCLGAASCAMADEAGKNAKIEEMLTLTKADAITIQVMDQVKSMQKAMLSKMDVPEEARAGIQEMQEKLFEYVHERMDWAKLKPAYIKMYGETYSEEELNGIVEFYKSPAGQAMLAKLPVLTQKGMAIVQQQMGDIMPEIQKMAQEMQEKAKAGAEKK